MLSCLKLMVWAWAVTTFRGSDPDSTTSEPPLSPECEYEDQDSRSRVTVHNLTDLRFKSFGDA